MFVCNNKSLSYFNDDLVCSYQINRNIQFLFEELLTCKPLSKHVQK